MPIDITLLPPEHRAKAEFQDWKKARGEMLGMEIFHTLSFEEIGEMARRRMAEVDAYPLPTRKLIWEHGLSMVRVCLKRCGYRHARLEQEIHQYRFEREMRYLEVDL